MDMPLTSVSRACDLLLATSFDEPLTLEHIADGQCLAYTIRDLFVLRNINEGRPWSLVPPIDQYGDSLKRSYTVLFLCRDDAEAAKKYEEEKHGLHLRIDPLSEIPEIEDLHTC